MSWDFDLEVACEHRIGDMWCWDGDSVLHAVAEWLKGEGHEPLAERLLGHNNTIPGTRAEVTENYTWNVSPMFYACTPGEIGISAALDGRTGAEAVPVLRDTLKAMLARKGEMVAMNPENGWGSYDGALRLLLTLCRASEANPDGVWRVR